MEYFTEVIFSKRLLKKTFPTFESHWTWRLVHCRRPCPSDRRMSEKFRRNPTRILWSCASIRSTDRRIRRRPSEREARRWHWKSDLRSCCQTVTTRVSRVATSRDHCASRKRHSIVFVVVVAAVVTIRWSWGWSYRYCCCCCCCYGWMVFPGLN